MGGYIKVQSEVEKGTKFTFRIKLKESQNNRDIFCENEYISILSEDSLNLDSWFEQ